MPRIGYRERRMCPSVRRGEKRRRRPGERYRDTHFDVCFCSPLIRARETAALLLWGRDVPIVEDARLEEMGFGICEGTSDFVKNPESPIYPLDFMRRKRMEPRRRAAKALRHCLREPGRF